MAARTRTVVSFAICFILSVDSSSRGAGANGGSWGGCVDNGELCGVGWKLSNRLFGALAGTRFFFGFASPSNTRGGSRVPEWGPARFCAGGAQ
jgi:hypothetical protein